MSLTTNEELIKSILDQKLLRRIPQNKSIENGSTKDRHDSYSLEWKPVQLESYISNKYSYLNQFTLQIGYIAMNNDELLLAKENLVLIVDALRDANGFYEFAEDGIDFQKIDDSHYKGILKFNFGLETIT